jgi:glycerol-3-phosphate dehydrogenase
MRFKAAGRDGKKPSPAPAIGKSMNRDTSLHRITARTVPWDIAIIGGGATGVGIAVDAASRGYAVCLLEQSDFGKGTSSRSTKLIHGGVRYLQQGNIALVTEALHERGLLRLNAPHLVHDLTFVVPNYQWWEAPFYGIGLKAYDLLAGQYGFGKSRHLSQQEVLRYIPALKTEGLRGGVLYHDGQFDDARLLMDLAATADGHGAALLNYAPVTGLEYDANGRLRALRFMDLETSASYVVAARCVINATGAFSDHMRREDDASARMIIAPSQGVHLVLDRRFLSGDAAMMVPHTRDGRVMFAIPWLGRTLLGTTDTAVQDAALEPIPQAAEIDFLLDTAGRYLASPPKRSDILSMFAGIRPLVKASHGENTAALSRDHVIDISASGMLTIAGGKWTTYRRMAEDAVDHAISHGQLDPRPCVTRGLKIGASQPYRESIQPPLLTASGAAWAEDNHAPLHSTLSITAADIIFAVRHAMARTVDDVLARRTRSLLLDARAAMTVAPVVAGIMAAELGRDQNWVQQQAAEFTALARNYLPPAT